MCVSVSVSVGVCVCVWLLVVDPPLDQNESYLSCCAVALLTKWLGCVSRRNALFFVVLPTADSLPSPGQLCVQIKNKFLFCVVCCGQKTKRNKGGNRPEGGAKGEGGSDSVVLCCVVLCWGKNKLIPKEESDLFASQLFPPPPSPPITHSVIRLFTSGPRAQPSNRCNKNRQNSTVT